MAISVADLQCLRKKLGVYFLYNKDKELVYVGYSGNMYVRILEHIADGNKQFQYFKALEFKDIKASQFAEIYIISIEKPKYNKLVCDDFKRLWQFIYHIVDKDVDHIEMNEKTSFALKADGEFAKGEFNNIIYSAQEWKIKMLKEI